MSFFNFCFQWAEKNPFHPVVGCARSLLALGTFITLIFNEKEIIFPKHFFIKNDFLLAHKINFFYLFNYENLIYAQIIAAILLLIVIIGFYPRWTCIFHWWISWSFFSAAAIIEGGDQITAIITFLLIPIGLVDGRKNHFENDKTYFSFYKNLLAWSFIFLIQLQMAIIYLQAGIEKLYKTPEWLDGTALYYWLNHNLFGMPTFLQNAMNDYILSHPLLISSLNWGIIIFEILLFAALFMSSENRKKFFVPAVLFHLLIWIFHGLFTFFLAMSAGLLLYLNPNLVFLKNKIK